VPAVSIVRELFALVFTHKSLSTTWQKIRIMPKMSFTAS
jgi:hypothetical protein